MTKESRDTDSARTIIVRLPVETHKALRIKVAEEDTSIQQWVLSLIQRKLDVGEPSRRQAADKAGRK